MVVGVTFLPEPDGQGANEEVEASPPDNRFEETHVTVDEGGARLAQAEQGAVEATPGAAQAPDTRFL